MQMNLHAKEFVQTDHLSYEEWLQYRRLGMGGSGYCRHLWYFKMAYVHACLFREVRRSSRRGKERSSGVGNSA